MESLPGVLRPVRRGQQIGVPARHSGPFFSGLDRTSKPRPLPAIHAPARYHFHHPRGWAVAHAHFFKISRSSWRIRFSLRSRASSSRSAVVRPVRPFERSACACLTHWPSADGTKSSSRATPVTLLPSSRTKRTACCLNSSVKRRRGRRLRVSAIADIVSTFRKMSTKPDQVQSRWAELMALGYR
jgi:hypothetical protein